LYGRSEHRRQVAPQLDAEFLSRRRRSQHDGVHEAAQGLGHFDTTFGLLERRGELRDLRAVDAGHLRMQKRRRLVSRGGLCLERFAHTERRADSR